MATSSGEHERTGVRRDRAWADQGPPSAGIAAQLRVWYSATPPATTSSLNETVNDILSRTGTLSEHDADGVYNLYLSPHTPRRQDRQGRHARDGRDRAGDGDGGCGRRLGQQLLGKPCRRVAQSSCGRSRRRAHHHRKPRRHGEGDGAGQSQAGRASLRLQAGDQPASAQSRSRAQ